MLEITVAATDAWDEQREIFITTKEQTLRLEHSLISLSKWESKWCKPFLTNHQKTLEETIDYIRCMTLDKNVDPNVYYVLSKDNLRQIYSYIENPMTATTFNQLPNQQTSSGNSIVTSELIYYWMASLNIPFECEKWHINRLITLIRITEVKNAPPQKIDKRELMTQYSELNKARRKRLNTKG